MLTVEQERILENACAMFLEARQKKEDTVAALRLVNDAFGMLSEHIDEVDDIYYRVVFANCIEELQRKGKGILDDVAEIFIQFKVKVYIELLNWFLDTPQYKTSFRGQLIIAFDALARLCLLGKDGLQQNDHYAYVCYQCLKMLDMPMVDELYLQDFVQDKETGLWKFFGVRPL